MLLKNLRIDHIGIAVKNLEKAVSHYQTLFEVELSEPFEVSEQKVRGRFVKFQNSKLELLEPTSAESPIHAFILKKGEGMHHLAYRVEDINQTIKYMEEKGLRMVDYQPRIGALGKLIAFAHPSAFMGILVEFCQVRD